MSEQAGLQGQSSEFDVFISYEECEPDRWFAEWLVRKLKKNKLRVGTLKADLSVRVIAGPAGVGKTRLAHELIRGVPEGWQAGLIEPRDLVDLGDSDEGCWRLAWWDVSG